MLLDVPSVFDTKSGPYEPLNYDRRFHGPVPLRVALASSLNVPAVRMLDEIGVEALLETAHRFGLNTLTDAEVYGLALTLGGGEVRLLDLTNAYAAIANGGQLTQPYVIERVRDAEGNVVYEHGQETPRRVLSEENAYLLADILADAGAREVGFGFAPTLRLPFTAAVKTGTTTEFRDNWTLGFTPERVVGVWVGNADNTAMNNISGIDGAGPIWNGVMQAANDGLSPSWPEPPPSLRRVPVCVPAGLLPGPACPSTALEWFVPGTEPRETEDYYARSPDGLLRVDPPAEARAWAMSAGLELVQDGVGGGSTFIVQPANGAVLYMAPELASRTALLRASPPSGTQSIEFRIDGSLVATAPANDPVAVWNLTPGAHVLEVRAVLAGGGSEVATTAFEVRG
jgi:membrane carboxypeptidase/penicillin-binding protein PbpC